MSKSYLKVDHELVGGIRLLMTDIDGTITDSGGNVEAVAADAIRALMQVGIMVGFVTGRTLPRLESPAIDIGVDGPIIGENGGIAKLRPGGKLLDLGYSRAPALRDLSRLRRLYPGAIEQTEDDADRYIDVGFKAQGVAASELREHLQESELLDSGYMLHLLQNGISKGGTLKRILGLVGGRIMTEQVLVVGDSPTDISLFAMFPHSVLVRNSKMLEAGRREVESAAEYASELEFGTGFAQVAEHILRLRR